ncbi:hypothetical protein HFD88_010639 [Aspergillus terreus]|nr:hypothetical protein HFD88_010639 [Aspergillus terreus]
MESKFKVIIVGGSISGLTLSHCLNAAGISNIVLEKHTDITAQVGASIGVLPNGAKILDQLGLFSRIEKLIEPLTRAHIAYPDGYVLASDYPVTVKERYGYPLAFLSRQELIGVLYHSFQDNSHIRTGQQVAKLEDLKDRVRVTTNSGVTYEGDLVVGADGVHSQVRSEMWSFSNSPCLGRISSQEQKGLTVEFLCVFGISSAVPGLDIGEQVACFHDGFTIMTYQGLGGQVYWFIVQKLDRKFTYPYHPSFSKQDAVNVCERLGNVWLRDTVHFRHVWANRETFAVTPLEEGIVRPWHSGRMVCIGDSIHKMTPNLGQGANLAIEDAAELANFLHAMTNKMGSAKPSRQHLHDILHAYQTKHVKRVSHVCYLSAYLARLHSRQGLIHIIMGRYLPPILKDIPADLISNVVHDAVTLSYLPSPGREATGWTMLRNLKIAGLVLTVVVAFLLTAMVLHHFI